MANEDNRSLINLGGLSKPADTLIKKVSEAVGGIFAPFQIKRIAKAEAEAALIFAKAETEIMDLKRRAIQRFLEEEATRQKNMEDITKKAISGLNDDADPGAVNDDWITNFFERARILSDEDMQKLWAKVLSGEANNPGTYSRRTVNLISDLEKDDALLFSHLCSFGWEIEDVKWAPLVFNINEKIYNKNGVNFESLIHLESLGLIQFNDLSGFLLSELPKRFRVTYYGQPLNLEMKADHNNQLELGKVLLTKAGRELAPICGSSPIEGFYEYIQEKWKKYLPEPPEHGTSADASTPRG